MHNLAMDVSSSWVRTHTESHENPQEYFREDLNVTKKKKYKPSTGCQEPYLALNNEEVIGKKKGFLRSLFSQSPMRRSRRERRSFNRKKQGQYMKIELQDHV